MNKASAYMKTETRKPQDSQNNENCPKHDISCAHREHPNGVRTVSLPPNGWTSQNDEWNNNRPSRPRAAV